MSPSARVVAIALAVLIGGCSIKRSETAHDAQTQMVGMGKEDVLACMGPAAQKSAEGGTEIWSYPSGNGAVSTVSTASETSFGSFSPYGETGNAFGIGNSYSQRRFCVVNVAFNHDQVRAIRYSGPTGGLLTQGEQCAYAIENCVH